MAGHGVAAAWGEAIGHDHKVTFIKCVHSRVRGAGPPAVLRDKEPRGGRGTGNRGRSRTFLQKLVLPGTGREGVGAGNSRMSSIRDFPKL